MKLKVITVTVLTLFLASTSTLTFNITSVNASGTIIYVDVSNTGFEDGSKAHPYNTIQEGINAANSGDTILVAAGIYYEHVIVNETVSIIGENRSTTIIDGNGTETIVHIEADDVEINGFTLQNGMSGIWMDEVSACVILNNTIHHTAGIYLDHCSNNVINGNIVTDNQQHGVFLDYSTGNNFSGNIISNNGWGFELYYSSNNFITDNMLLNNEAAGIYSVKSGANIIRNNSVTSNKLYSKGIFLYESGGSVLKDNNMTGNWYNFGVVGYQLSDYIQDIDTSNTVDEKLIYYWVSKQNKRVPTDAGYVAVINSKNITVRNLTLTKCEEGILFVYTTDSTIKMVNVTKNRRGISLIGSTNNNIYGNIITGNHLDGIYLAGTASSNTIAGNILSNNNHGMEVVSLNNIIYHNNFINNAKHVNTYAQYNKWDNNYSSGGNYWSDYKGKDVNGDGIGDTPYVIDGNNQDNYPLMGMFSNFTISWKNETYHVTTICNSTISAFHFNETSRLISFNVTGEVGVGFCRVSILTTLMQNLWGGNYTILVDGQPPLSIKNWTDETNTYLYFTYLHSTHEVTIVPEFTSTMISPLLLIIALIAVIAAKRTLISGVMKKERTTHV